MSNNFRRGGYRNKRQNSKPNNNNKYNNNTNQNQAAAPQVPMQASPKQEKILVPFVLPVTFDYPMGSPQPGWDYDPSHPQGPFPNIPWKKQYVEPPEWNIPLESNSGNKPNYNNQGNYNNNQGDYNNNQGNYNNNQGNYNNNQSNSNNRHNNTRNGNNSNSNKNKQSSSWEDDNSWENNSW